MSAPKSKITGVNPVRDLAKGGKQTIAVLVGTPMEAMKLAPVVRTLKSRQDEFETLVISATHTPQELDRIFPYFAIRADMSLDLGHPESPLSDLPGSALSLFEAVLRQLNPDVLLVQGHSTTVFTAALAAFNLNQAVGHLAGWPCRQDLCNPLVEEANRRLMTVLTEIHWVPTPAACCQLLSEGIPREKVVVTGNILVDSLKILTDTPFCPSTSPLREIPFEGHRILLWVPQYHDYTEPLPLEVGLALKELIDGFPDLVAVVVARMSEACGQAIQNMLNGTSRVIFLEPMDLPGFIHLIHRAYLIMTEVGGIEEEPSALGKPTLILTPQTYYPGVVQNDCSQRIEVSHNAIVREAARLLSSPDVYRAMLASSVASGDGHAAARIAESLSRRARGFTPFLDPDLEFPPAQRYLPSDYH